ncbi:hypothetical protein GLOIN_2v1708658 [Rhizophagus clarus]|nr:hypothetical protein GLOIN_2v1708658 [Rhizophagus clarus]
MWSNLKQKISDELSARVTRIVNDLDTKNNTPEIENIFSKLTAEINTKIANELSARISEINSTFTAELGKNNNKLTAEIKKLQVDFDQLSVANHSSSSESSSSRLSDSALEESRSRFKRVFDSNKEKGETLDYAFETVRHEIRELTGYKIGKSAVKSFYYGQGDPKFNIVMAIMSWVDEKEITNNLNNNNASSANNNNENNME